MAKQKPDSIILNKEEAAVRDACQGLQLLDIRLVSSRVLQTATIMLANAPPENLFQRINVQCQKDDNSSQVIVVIGFLLHATEKETIGDQEHYPFVLEANFAIAYGIADIARMDQKVAQKFAEQVGVFHIWPYWREFAQSMTIRMGLPPIRIQPLVPRNMGFTPSNQDQGSVQDKPQAKTVKHKKRR